MKLDEFHCSEKMPELTLNHVIYLAAIVAAIGIVWEAVEISWNRFAVLRFFDWQVVKSRYYILLRRPRLEKLFDFLCDDRQLRILVYLHAIAAIAFVIVFPFFHIAAVVCVALVLVGHLAIHLRMLVGLDGADQMQTIVWSGVFIYCLQLGNIAENLAVVLVVSQLCLSYWVAGIAKAISPTWRSGRAVSEILRTSTYGTLSVAKIAQHRTISLVACWMTIGFELIGPFLIFTGPLGTIVFLCAGLIFHISIALAMGLYTFVWAFVATYPLVLYVGINWFGVSLVS